MGQVRHSSLTGSSLHAAHRWTFANATARLAQSVSSSDVGKIALQSDDGSFWALSSHSPATWRRWNDPVPEWSTAPSTLIIGHRGTRVCAPENTIAAFDYAASLASVALETDVQSALDGGLVHMHDEYTTRTTGSAFKVTTTALDVLRRLDASQGYFPSVFGVQRVPTFEEFLIRYGRTHLLCPEVKSGTATATAMAQAIVRHGLQRSVAVQSFDLADLAAVYAVDPTIPLIFTVSAANVAAATPAIATANHLFAVAPEYSAAALTAGYVTNMHAVGVKVYPWTVNTYDDAAAALAKGVDGLMTDDPAYIARQIASPSARTATGTTTVPVPTVPGSGWILNETSSEEWTRTVAGGVVTFGSIVTVADDVQPKIYVPWIRPANTPATQTITTTLKLVAGPTSGDTTRFIGLRFCWTTDGDAGAYAGGTSTNGYYWIIRLNGNMSIARVTAGVLTNIAGPTASAAISAGDSVPITVALTATGITVTRTDTMASINVTDATHARGGYFSAFGSGAVPGLGETAVAY